MKPLATTRNVDTGVRVRIVAKDHPHYPETGTLTGEIRRLITGKHIAHMKLDSCAHGGEACYVGKGEVTEL